MVNVYVRFTPGGCIVQKAGEETCFPDLPTACSQSQDAAYASAQWRKLKRVVEYGQLKMSSVHSLTPQTQALTGKFKESEKEYQVTVFVKKTPEGRETVTALQTFPSHPGDGSPYRDIHITDPELLSFLNSSRLFIKS